MKDSLGHKKTRPAQGRDGEPPPSTHSPAPRLLSGSLGHRRLRPVFQVPEPTARSNLLLRHLRYYCCPRHRRCRRSSNSSNGSAATQKPARPVKCLTYQAGCSAATAVATAASNAASASPPSLLPPPGRPAASRGTTGDCRDRCADERARAEH
ncbi:Protein of unknown function [Gryllus bimaculatus]|nr:Protein of unknown function [Gryllus bimaculatus]